jgi:hypothetical protein
MNRPLPKLRVAADLLFLRNGRLRRREIVKIDLGKGRAHRVGMPFTGLAYCFTRGLLQKIRIVEHGVVTGVSDDWLALPDGGSRVDRSMLDPGEGYGPFMLGGAPFTGAAYDFEESGACASEVLYADGYPTETSQRAWYESGALKEIIDEGSYTSWFDDGHLERRVVDEIQLYAIITRDNGRLGDSAWRTSASSTSSRSAGSPSTTR